MNKKRIAQKQTNTIIFITTCVNPNGMVSTALQDPRERLAQYTQAIQWYLDNTNYKIVVVDNSRYDFYNIFNRDFYVKRLECIAYDGNDSFDKKKGKGYGEALIIKYGLEHSLFLSEPCRIVKVTGRLVVKNINFILKMYKKNSVVYANILNDGTRLFLDSRFFIANKDFMIINFCNSQVNIDESINCFFEHYLFDKAKNIVKEFLFPIQYNGYSGSSGELYRSSLLFYFKSFFHYTLHKFNLFFIKYKKTKASE